MLPCALVTLGGTFVAGVPSKPQTSCLFLAHELSGTCEREGARGDEAFPLKVIMKCAISSISFHSQNESVAALLVIARALI